MADSIPTREADLVTFMQNFNTLINAAPGTYSLLPAQSAAFDLLFGAYQVAYTVAAAPTTRTSVTISARNLAREAMMDGPGGFRELARIIQASPTVTDPQREALGLNPRDSEPTVIPPPAFAPQLAVQMSIGRVVKLRLRDAENPDRRGKPDGVDGATVLMFVGENPPASALQWSMLFNTSKTLVDIDLPDTIAPGAKVYFSAFWFNQRKESGPTAEPVSVRTADGLKAAA